METRMGDLEDLVRRQEQALNAMESKLCKCGGSRWAELLEDLQHTPGSVSSSLSYATPPVVPIAIAEVEVVPESPKPLPVREPAGVIQDDVASSFHRLLVSICAIRWIVPNRGRMTTTTTNDHSLDTFLHPTLPSCSLLPVFTPECPPYLV